MPLAIIDSHAVQYQGVVLVAVLNKSITQLKWIITIQTETAETGLPIILRQIETAGMGLPIIL